MQKGFSTILIILAVLITAVLIGMGGFYFFNQQRLKNITDFKYCSKFYPVMESYPGQCNTPDGRHFVQELSEEEKKKLIPPIQSSPSSGVDETSNWKNASYQTLGIQFKYPDGWVEVPTENNDNEVVFTSSDYIESENPMLPKSGIKISMNRFKTDQKRSFNVMAEELNQSAGVSKVKKTEIDGFEAVSYEVKYEGSYDKLIIPVNGYDWYFTIQFGGENEELIRTKEEYQQQIIQFLNS